MEKDKRFVHPYNYEPEFGEINDGEIKVETAGYIPAKKQIENLINAGIRLQESRAQAYDFPDGVETDEEFDDPTRNPGLDLAEASILARKSAETVKRLSKGASRASDEVLEGVSKNKTKEKGGEEDELDS